MKRERINLSSSSDIGKIQPQARDIEDIVIGSLLLEAKAFVEIEHILTKEDFYDPQNAIIFSAISDLATKKKPIDMITVVEQLKKMNELETIGGAYRIAELTSKASSSSHIVEHALIIKDKSTARQVISSLSLIVNKAYDESIDIADIIEELDISATNISSNKSISWSITLGEALGKSLDKAAKVQEERNSGKMPAIPTGISGLDREFAGGWRSPDLIVVGARPSMGKTQLSLSFAKAAALSDKQALFISIEMNATQLADRYLLEDEGISSYNLRTGQMSDDEWQRLDEQAGRLWGLKMKIADSPEIRYLSNIKAEARRLKRKGELDIMFIDYLGLIRTNLKFGTRDLEIGHITGELKNLAKELDIPIVLLAQLNRPIKGATVKEPNLEDLRESGNIEQDADIVIFIHRPGYYEPTAIDPNNVPWDGRGKLIISKYREGARNNTVIFHHDNNFKKLWGEESSYTNNNEGRPF